MNRNTLVGKGASEIFKHMMGIDDAAVERTGRIDGKGYGFRLRWQEILGGRRAPDFAYTNVVKLSLAYAVGNPGKLQETGKQRESLVFLTTNGLLPWDPRADSMKDIIDRMQAEQVRGGEARGHRGEGRAGRRRQGWRHRDSGRPRTRARAA